MVITDPLEWEGYPESIRIFEDLRCNSATNLYWGECWQESLYEIFEDEVEVRPLGSWWLRLTLPLMVNLAASLSALKRSRQERSCRMTRQQGSLESQSHCWLSLWVELAWLAKVAHFWHFELTWHFVTWAGHVHLDGHVVHAGEHADWHWIQVSWYEVV